ncbi:MAG: glycosyltransferase family 4 protein [Bacteroidales bacterium]|nr:glycosyltransferase family 4 protein [Bacteroidales bacterium]
MSRIWLISEYYYPVVVTTGYYVTEIAEYLAKKGKNVGVICTNNTYYESDTISSVEHELRNGVEIFRALDKKITKNNLVKRALRLFLSSISLYKLAKKYINEGDEVIVLTNPAFMMLFMSKIRRLTGCRYHILVHDIFPENLVSIGKFSNQSLVFKCLKKFFDKAYADADSCISIGCDMTEVIKTKINNSKPITKITNWADIDDVSLMNKKETKLYAEYKEELKDNIVFMFAGNLGKAQGLDNYLEAINITSNINVRFLFVGAGAKSEDIKSFSKSNDKVVFAGFRNRSEQNDFLNACDIGVVTLADGMFGLGVPSKSYNLMATGKPILYIGDYRSEIADCIKRYNIGWVVEPNNPHALKEMIEAILKHPEEIHTKGIVAKKVANEVFAKPVVLEKYNSFFEK